MQQSWLAARVASVDGMISQYKSEINAYFELKSTNEILLKQNKELMEKLYGKENFSQLKKIKVNDSIHQGQVFSLITGEVIDNNINRKNNYFIINRGRKNGVKSPMSVISPQGIAGIVINTTDKYAVVQSVLSVDKIRINASLKKSGYFGTLTWQGKDTRLMNLSDIPKYVSIKVGDTVVTDVKSTIFPKGHIIGTITGYQVDNKTGNWDISVELSQKMGNLRKIFVVDNLRKVELKKIQDTLNTEMLKDD